jgi:hypothetical protein
MHEKRNEQRTYDEVLADAVRVLIEAARRAIAWTDADGVEHREQRRAVSRQVRRTEGRVA